MAAGMRPSLLQRLDFSKLGPMPPSCVRCLDALPVRPILNRLRYVGEEISGNGDLGHLEANEARITDDLRADLEQLFAQRRHRPIPDRLRRRQSAQEVSEVVGQCVKLKANWRHAVAPDRSTPRTAAACAS